MASIYIKRIRPNLLGGNFTTPIDFEPGLNLLSGENGTGKTKLLSAIQQRQNLEVSDEASSDSLKILSISPKRNAERKNIETILNEIRRSSKRLDTHIEAIRNQAFTDNTFVGYPTAGELFLLTWEHLSRDGSDRRKHMTRVRKELNRVIAQVFPNLKFNTKWNDADGTPNLFIEKNEESLDVIDLSCGEQEMLSLVLNLHVSKNLNDVILIDEPEIHLNWDLEEKLFNYLLDLASEEGPQVIVATHSRIVFRPEFIPKTKFLTWESGSIDVQTHVDESIKAKLAGEALQIVTIGEFSRPTFFVEDKAQESVLLEIAESVGASISVTRAGNRENVRSLFRLCRSEGGWGTCFFVEDGDGQGNPYEKETFFFHLDRYCIENYLLDPSPFCKAVGWIKSKYQREILQTIQNHREKILGSQKHLGFLVDRLKTSDMKISVLSAIDGSKILPSLIKKVKIKRRRFIQKYISAVNDSNRLKRVFPKELIDAIYLGK